MMNNQHYRIECTVKGRVYRPHYTGIVNISAPSNTSVKDLPKMIANQLNRSSFKVDGVRVDEIVIHRIEILT